MKNNKKSKLIIAVLMLIGAVCFGIVSFFGFYRHDYLLGTLCLFACICDLVSFGLNLYIYNRKRK